MSVQEGPRRAGETRPASIRLTGQQRQVADPALRGTLFVSGPAGAGKTTAAVHRLRRLLQAGVRADSILVLLPQRTLVRPYREALRDPALAAGAAVAVTTVGGLAKRVVELFWPLVAEEAGFAEPEREPVFLTMETAQYYMARVMQPLLRDGCFDSLAIDRNRIYSQVLDNLNKSAVVGFDHLTIGDRLRAASGSDPVQERVYRDVQACATAFRRFCLEHGLLDFSLQMEVFARHLMAVQPARRYLVRLHRHLIADNVEEDTPVAHDLLLSWLGEFASAVVICDDDAGYRRFLGADPEDGLRLRDACDTEVRMDRLPEADPSLSAFERRLAWHLQPAVRRPHDGAGGDPFPVGDDGVLRFAHHRYYPEMLDWVAARIAGLIEEGVAPGEIVVLAPFLSDALRFALVDRLDRLRGPAPPPRPPRGARRGAAARRPPAPAAAAPPPR
ncbi:MAG: AAA family ATPase, partial [Spirochaetaceae bacterium]|nr:AAA family ATPase [Spirochaetaceae bacterium]